MGVRARSAWSRARIHSSVTGIWQLPARLYVVSLFFQDGRGLSALIAGLSTFPEALGVMGGAQLVSRVLYPMLGRLACDASGQSVSILFPLAFTTYQPAPNALDPCPLAVPALVSTEK